MRLIISWIQNNKLYFLIIDSILLISNTIILNCFKNNSIFNIDFVLYFIIIYILFGLLFIFSKIWIWFTQKYHFLFIPIDDGIGEIMSYYGTIFFIVLNCASLFLIWVYENFIIYYFTIPWIIIIFANVHTLYDEVPDTKFEEKRQVQ